MKGRGIPERDRLVDRLRRAWRYDLANALRDQADEADSGHAQAD